MLPVLYCAASLLYAMHFGGPMAPVVRLPRRVVVAAALGTHVGLLALHAVSSRSFPASEFWTTTSAVALGLGLLFLFTRRRVEDEGAGFLVFGVVALMQLCASAFGPLEPRPIGAAADFLSISHATTSVLAGSAVMLSGLHGSLYLLVMRRMRRGSFGPLVEHMPDLRTLALLTRRAALAGFLLLTVGVNLGIAWAHATDIPDFGYTDHWVLAMFVLWIHFGIVAFSRSIRGFSAQRASFAAALGLAIFLIAGLVSLLPHGSFHWAS